MDTNLLLIIVDNNTDIMIVINITHMPIRGTLILCTTLI